MFREIFPSVFFFENNGFGSNVFLLSGKKIVLIDSGAAADAPTLKDSLAKIGFGCGQVELVLHTHGHADHFGSDFLFPNAKIRMHKFDAKHVNSHDAGFTAANVVPVKDFPKINSFFKENELVDLGNFKLRVLFSSGHTKGSVCFFEKKLGLLFSGDTLFNAGFGRFDLPSGNAKELKRSLEKLLPLDFSLLLPGHGSLLKGSQKPNIESALECLSNEFL